MTGDGTAKKRGYHHGNLRTALVAAATALIDDLGIEALTLRELAKRVGVTHAAPYRHFRDKSALLRAVSNEGFGDLAARLREAAGRSPDPDAPSSATLRCLVTAYLDFAAERTALYRLMLGAHHFAPSPGPDGGAPAAVLAELRRVIPRAAGGEAGLGSPSAVLLWAQLHGLALLRADCVLPAHALAHSDALIDGIVNSLRLH